MHSRTSPPQIQRRDGVEVHAIALEPPGVRVALALVRARGYFALLREWSASTNSATGGEDRAVVGRECGIAILQPAFDGFSGIGIAPEVVEIRAIRSEPVRVPLAQLTLPERPALAIGVSGKRGSTGVACGRAALAWRGRHRGG
jgi:hypothetical protein